MASVLSRPCACVLISIYIYAYAHISNIYVLLKELIMLCTGAKNHYDVKCSLVSVCKVERSRRNWEISIS